MKFTAYLLSLLLLSPAASRAQRNEILAPHIASLQVVAGDDWLSPPVIRLSASEYSESDEDTDGESVVNIDFDDLTHEYHRYCYRLEHCNADWTVSTGLFSSDFVSGFAEGNTIDDHEESINTNQLYTHYHLSLPNDQCQIKMSGNYRLTVYDENQDDKEVLRCYFMVLESRAQVTMAGTSNTDIDINGSHQQISMQVDFGNLSVTDPSRQIYTVVTQNRRWDNAVVNPKPQYILADAMRWDHCRDLIFPAGNEYRKFEVLDVDHTTLGLEDINWDGQAYHAWVWTDEPRPNYVYDEDANGAFYLRNSDNVENNTESEYYWAHFRLKAPRQNGTVYLNGVWTYDSFLPQYEMKWNERDQLYEDSVWLKQGYYSYQYLLQRDDGSTTLVPSEGSFFQTENQYQAYIYYRGKSDRADRLVGYLELQLK